MSLMLRNLLKPKMSNLELVKILTNIKEKPRRAFGSVTHLEALEKFCETHSVTKKNNEGLLPLHVAIDIIPEEKVIEVFLKFGANLNAKDDIGFTALHCACTKAKPSLIDYLLKHGTNPNLLTNSNTSACQMSIALLFESKNFENHDYLEGSIQICCRLIEVTDNLETPWAGNNLAEGTCLMKDAVDLNLLKVVQKLLDNGVPVPDHNLTTSNPYFAIMHMALSNGRKDNYAMLKLLLENGGNSSESLISPERCLIESAPNSRISKLLKSYGATHSN